MILYTMAPKDTITSLLAPGDVGTIAKQLGLSQPTVSQALRRANPGHPAVRLALKLAEDSGALAAAQTLATLTLAR
jgi:hypothetical protein